MKLDNFVSDNLELPSLTRHQELQAHFREKTKLIILTFSNLQLSSQKALNFISHVGTCFIGFSKEIQELTADQDGASLYDALEELSPLVSLIIQYYKSFRVFFQKVLEDYDEFQLKAGENFSKTLQRFEGLKCEVQLNSESPVKAYEEFLAKVIKAKNAFELKVKDAQKFLNEKKDKEADLAYNLTYAKNLQEKEEALLKSLLDAYQYFTTLNAELELQEADIILRSRNNEKGLLEFYELALELVVNSMGDMSSLFSTSFESMCQLIKCKVEEMGNVKISHTLENHEAQVLLSLKNRDSIIPVFKDGYIESLQADQVKDAVEKFCNYVDHSFKLFESKKNDFTNLQRLLSEIWTLLAAFSKEFPGSKEISGLSMTCLQNFSSNFHTTFHDFLSIIDQVSINFLQVSSYLNSLINKQMNVIIEDQSENEMVINSQAKLILKKLYAEQSLGPSALIAAKKSLSELFRSYYQQEDSRVMKLKKMLQDFHIHFVESSLEPLYIRNREFNTKLRSDYKPGALKDEVYKILLKNQKLSIFLDDWMTDTDETSVESQETAISKDTSLRSSFDSRLSISKVPNRDFKLIGNLNSWQQQQAKNIDPPVTSVRKAFTKDLMYKFNALENEVIIDTFSCTFSDNLLLQGRLYLTTKRLAFQSPFNVKTVFGETVVVVPNGEIRSLERDKLLFGISNILHINTIHGRVTFSSFASSDRAIKLIDEVLSKTSQIYQGILNKNQQNNARGTPNEDPDEEEKVSPAVDAEEGMNNGKKKGKKKSMAEQYAKAVSLRRKKVMAQIVHKNQYDHVPLDYNIEKTSLQKVFQVFFADTPLDIDGQHYMNFWELIVTKSMVTNYDIRKWDPVPPTHLGNLKELSTFPLFSERTISGSKPLKQAVPFIPKDILYRQSDKLLILDPKEVWVTSSNQVLNKIPLSDCFTFKQAFILKEVNESTVNIQIRWFVEFHKSTMFKGTLLSSTDRENKEFANDVILACIKQAWEKGMFEVKPEDIYHMEEEAQQGDEEEDEEEDKKGINLNEEDEGNLKLQRRSSDAASDQSPGGKVSGGGMFSDRLQLFKKQWTNPTKQSAHAVLMAAVGLTAAYLIFTLVI